jgi:rhodanese-related sulfurtransferase
MFNIDEYSIDELLYLFDIRSPSDFNEDHIDNRVIALMRNFTGLQQNKSMIFLGDAREKILEYMRIYK